MRFCISVVLILASANLYGAEIDFNRDIRPILFSHCVACHGPDEESREAGLRLDTLVDASADLGGRAAIVPNDPQGSEAVRRITSHDPSERMPPEGKGRPLNDREIELLTEWIAQGARYAKHWAYEPPRKAALPEVLNRDWPTSSIDHFVLAKLESMQLAPSPEADRRTLARRLSLAITGLPPSPDEVDSFLNDADANAYERYVDALLSKPTYGERWARDWLDLARYADSAGYADDPLRTIWAYRDYVIRAFNQNMPFDQFTIEQIAGDLLENPTEDQSIATAFHRNTMTNNEGGTNDEQFRNEAIVDRVNTTMAVWMGTTIACAQCHTHKYDPITQAEYFQLFDFFNQSQDADRQDEAPTLEIWKEPIDRMRRDELRSQVARLQEVYERTTPEFEAAFEQWLKNLKKAEANVESLPEKIRALALADSLDDNQRKEMSNYFRSQSSLFADLRQQLDSAKKELDKLKPVTTVPVMQDRAQDQRRQTAVQLRGNYQSLGEIVHANVPAVFPALQADAPKNRLGLAKWLVSKKNPLTARVVVNRYWEQLFGIGIVETSEEFGSQGELPTHPELLDYLAVDLMEHEWDLKHLLKQIVMSSTFRQSSEVTPALLEADPQNRYFARGPRFRLPAETVRDQALAVSGLLSLKMFGPPVNPPQPELGLSAAFGSKTDWQTSTGADRYRRAIYTSWRRSNPYPSMATFDAPNREVCTLRRTRTNTPLQALVTLNDPVFIEAAQSLAREMAILERFEDKLHFAFRRVLLRTADDQELQTLERLYDQLENHYKADTAAARKMAEEPLGPLDEKADVVELASLTVIANVLLNLDEFLMPR